MLFVGRGCGGSSEVIDRVAVQERENDIGLAGDNGRSCFSSARHDRGGHTRHPDP
jgi:hypothetical protein